MAAQDDGDQGRVAGQAAHGLGAEQGARVRTADHRAGPEPFAELVDVDGDEQLRLGGRGHRLSGGDGPPHDLDQGVAAALVAGAQVRAVLRGPGRGQGPQGRLEDGPALHVEGQAVLE
ncbi:MAG TPA: hypothetical protein VHN18_00595, partial [Micromonosporaceae bacterium]|nr:hypothetical protein [Micromonosporaceae bacterium]